jgi:hypothetical protein
MATQNNTVLTLKLTVEEAKVVVGALSTQPFQAVVGIINTIQMQAAEQLNSPQEPTEPG